MTIRSWLEAPIAAVACAFVLGCATSAPATPPPSPAAVAESTPQQAPAGAPTARLSLEPPDPAVRYSVNAQLTGRELGTMWTFENPPLDYWKEEYGFGASPQWLEHVRLSSVRYGEYCSASFVSPDGLAMTNHHCVRECVEANSSPDRDFVVIGFQAAGRAEERICPDLFLDQLVAIEDITAKMRAAGAAGGSDAEVAEAIQRATRQIENDCATRSGNTCQVVTLFQGGQYQLYQYHRFEPVKLVFAPELQAGFFGGDPDNFTYPRHALDVGFVRAYGADGRPAHTPHYFTWSADGASDGELVFVTGNPGSTSRLITVAQLMYERVYRHPVNIQLLTAQRAMLEQWAKSDPQAESELRQDMFEVENSLKALRGELAGLRDSTLIGLKIRWERDFRERIEANPAAKPEFGDVWARIEDIQKRKLMVSPPLNALNLQLIGSPHFGYGAQLVRYVQELAKPESERSQQYRGPGLQQIRTALQTAAPVNADLAAMTMRYHLELADAWLEPGSPAHALLFRPRETPETAADRLAATSRILDASFRRQIVDGGVAALESSTDPILVLAREAAARIPALTDEWRAIQAAETVQKQRLARALFAVYGTSLPPDATFTLRISDGRVKGYAYNGTLAPPFTTFHGMWSLSAGFRNEMPWTLPPAFVEAQDRIRMTTPMNFVSTTDITGGNSGSPVIDQQGRVVGLAFDGNIEQLPNEFLFRIETGGRTVSVHSAAIVEALRSIYGADALLRELLGQRTGTGGARQ